MLLIREAQKESGVLSAPALFHSYVGCGCWAGFWAGEPRGLLGAGRAETAALTARAERRGP